jgi:hypothetical protein
MAFEPGFSKKCHGFIDPRLGESVPSGGAGYSGRLNRIRFVAVRVKARNNSAT